MEPCAENQKAVVEGLWRNRVVVSVGEIRMVSPTGVVCV